MTKVLTIVGNRPQFIKLGVTARSLRQRGSDAPFENIVVNTGQHYDQMLSDVFFSELDIEAPKYNLGMGSGHIVDQIGRMMAPLREVFDSERPDALLVYGDTNSTIAGALVAAHTGVPVLHVEGGERLYRRMAMPEETNRIVTDHLSDLCLASSQKAVRYLAREGFGPDRVRFVGDPMYDIFKLSGEMLASREAALPGDFGLGDHGYGLCTIHRAENTDDRDICLALLKALDDAPHPVLLPAHPRLKHRLEGWGWAPRAALRLIDPLGYFDFQSLLRRSAFIVTDSGGVGREAFFAGKPAIVPLESSAWIEAVEAGLAIMTGRSGDRLAEAMRALPPPQDVSALIEANFGNGAAGARIVDETAAFVAARSLHEEGAWHMLGRFDQLPKAVDASMLSHARFRSLSEQAARENWTNDRLILDVSASLEGVDALAAIARQSGAAFTLYIDVAASGFNPLHAGLRARYLTLAEGAAFAVADRAHAAMFSAWLGRDVSHLPDVPAEAEDDNGTVANLDALRLRPWLWAAIPVSPFEARQSLQDAVRDDLAAAFRSDIGLHPDG